MFVCMVEVGVGVMFVLMFALCGEVHGVSGFNICFFYEDEVVFRRIGLCW